MAKNWTKISNNWYYFGSSGAMSTGWLDEGGYRYYLNSNGVMLTGVQTINNSKYYFTSSGALRTGWFNDGNDEYYALSDGKLATGWSTVNGESLYFESNGTLAKGGTVIDGKVYYFKQGKLVKESLTENNVSYVINSSTGEVTQVTINKFQLLKQTDSRWAYNTVGGYTVKSTGCTPTCLAMIINWFNGTNYTPYEMYKDIYNNKYGYPYDNCDGAIFFEAAKNGLVATSIKTKEEMKQALLSGSIVAVALGGTWMHGINGTHQIIFGGFKDNKTYCWDPYFSQNTGWYDLDSIFNNLSDSEGDVDNGGPVIAISRN
jgi:hypothetical protein